MGYWFDDDDVFSEPSEADQIMDDAKEKLFQCLNEYVKSYYDGWKDAKPKLDDLNRKLYEKENELRAIEDKIRKAEEKAENLDSEMPQKYVDAFVRKYTGNVAPGDKVWVAGYSTKCETCPMCNGKKRVTVNIGDRETEIKCPECDGYGHKTVYTYAPAEKHVKDVRLSLVFRDEYHYRVNAWTADTVNLNDSDYYIGKDKFFLTKEEAQADCDKRNKKEKK